MMFNTFFDFKSEDKIKNKPANKKLDDTLISLNQQYNYFLMQE